MAKKRASTQAESFLEDIRVHPDDDAPRLVYADWLTDQGQPERAELIRVQCRLAGLSEDDPEWADVKDREWELLTLHRIKWREDLPAWARKEPYKFRRGFVSWISTTATQFLRSAALFKAAPIQGLQLRTLIEKLAEVAACPLLARLSALEVGRNNLFNNPLSNPLKPLLVSPHLTGLRELNLSGNGVGLPGLQALAAWPPLARITSLDLSDTFARADCVEELGASPHLSSLIRLDIGRNPLRPRNCEALGNSAGFARLTHLALAQCEMLDDSIRALVPSLSRLRDLTLLDLSGNRFGSDGARAQAMSMVLGRLTSLILRECALGFAGATELARSRTLGNLRRLDLADNHLGSEEAATLASARFESLKSLQLDRNNIDPAGMDALAQSPQLNSLEALMLSFNRIGSRGALAIASSPYLTNLKSLRLGRNVIGPEGAAALAASPNLAGLTTLDLAQNALGEEGVRALAVSPYLANLRTLDLGECHINEKAALALASANLPQLRKLLLRGNNLGISGSRALALSPSLPRLVVLSINYGDPDYELVQRKFPTEQAAPPT